MTNDQINLRFGVPLNDRQADSPIAMALKGEGETNGRQEI